ncbi:MAG: transmembrane anchor protein [Robiginitomaculum sp.]|nr:transmembrane anchor protein [Robiginitomaculum sp.]
MNNSNSVDQTELPSTKRLLKSTLLAAVGAGVILVTIVMPAEYGIDPTGVGKVLGLQKMGEIKVSLAEEAAADRLEDLQDAPVALETEEVEEAIITPEVAVKEPDPEMKVALEPVATTLSHEMKVTLVPNEGAEIKLKMNKGQTANYSWVTDAGRANFDIHADSVELKIKYHSYAKGSKQSDEGVVTAEFDGYHGWFWRNRTDKTMTITLQTNGQYLDIVRLK